jgi:8-oxo-dGTP pyrophosphatase MutT (NUDIX family)
LNKADKTLLIRRFNTGYEDGNYSLIGGHIEDGETAYATMKREAKEEAGLEIDEGDLRVIHVLHRKTATREYIEMFLTADVDKEPRNVEPEKCDEMKWVSSESLPSNTIDYIRFVLERVAAGEAYSEFGF